MSRSPSTGSPSDDEVAVKLVHTADWHLGKRFLAFEESDNVKLSRARLAAVDRILGLADQHAADAVLCAGDLFDGPTPEKEWWTGLAQKLNSASPSRPIFLLPGNHDPLTARSVYSADHPFRAALPQWVHVVDQDDFEYEITPDAVLYARPCRSLAGQDDLALALPARDAEDERIRVGMVHGSTFDIEGADTHFPISIDAAKQRGLDYLAIGDHHGFRDVPTGAVPPTVYPGTPEATKFGERDAGHVALVLITRRRRVTFHKERVSHWQWTERECTSLNDLRGLAHGTAMRDQVMRLRVRMGLGIEELAEAEDLLAALKGTAASHGRIGILDVDRSELRLDNLDPAKALEGAPDVLQKTAARLVEIAEGMGGAESIDPEVAKHALLHLHRALQELQT